MNSTVYSLNQNSPENGPQKLRREKSTARLNAWQQTNAGLVYFINILHHWLRISQLVLSSLACLLCWLSTGKFSHSEITVIFLEHTWWKDRIINQIWHWLRDIFHWQPSSPSFVCQYVRWPQWLRLISRVETLMIITFPLLLKVMAIEKSNIPPKLLPPGKCVRVPDMCCPELPKHCCCWCL